MRYLIDGGKLKGAMEKRGYSSNSLAMAAGLTARCVLNFVHEERQPKADTLLRMCDLLGTEPRELMRRV